jgi:hypothetical protein
MNNSGKLENQFLCLSDTDLQYVSGGSYNFKVDVDKLVDYATRALVVFIMQEKALVAIGIMHFINRVLIQKWKSEE